jgi:hypothetical protein
MKLRSVLIIVLLNTAVLCAGFFFFRWLAADEVATRSVLLRDQLTREQQQRPSKATPAAGAEGRVVYVTNKFNWAQVESADYRVYIGNLRAIGCPESTIKDIILTDVMKLYAQRRGQASLNGREFRYWETDEKRKLKQHQIEEREKTLAQIDKELPTVLRELLGINYEKELDKYFVDTSEDDRRLAFLADDKRTSAIALREQYDAARERILSESGGHPTADDLDRMQRLQQEMDSRLSQVLTPEEKFQFELSTSPTADALRKNLIGFNPSEAEFREIYQRQKAIDATFANQDLNDPTVRAAKDAAQKQMEDELFSALGQSRMVDFQTVKNPDYRDVFLFSERFDLPDTVSQSLVAMRTVAQQQREQLLANANMSDEIKAQALRAIQAETEKTIRQTLGDKVYAAYTQSAGGWLRELGAN